MLIFVNVSIRLKHSLSILKPDLYINIIKYEVSSPSLSIVHIRKFKVHYFFTFILIKSHNLSRHKLTADA